MTPKIFFTSFIILGCILASVNTSKCSLMPGEKTDVVYDFVNFYLKAQEQANFKLDPELLNYNNEKFNIDSILDKKDFNDIIGPKVNFETMLSVNDITFMKEQIAHWKGEHRLNTAYLKINSDRLLPKSLSAINITKSRSKVIKLSIPIFSLNYKIALIYTETYCGIDCGEGSIQLFEKQAAGKWRRVSVKSIWTS